MMPTKSQQELLKGLASRYHAALQENPEAIAYLVGRGLSKEAVEYAQIGVITKEYGPHESYAGWISIPYIVLSGGVVGWKFRRLHEGNPKYGSPAGQKSHLYNVRDLDVESDTLVICEGEFDTLIISQILEIPAVGCPGVASWKEHFPRLVQGRERVLIVGDNDDKADGSNPGQDFARRVAQEVPNAQIVQLPSGMDITDCYLAEGPEKLRERLAL